MTFLLVILKINAFFFFLIGRHVFHCMLCKRKYQVKINELDIKIRRYCATVIFRLFDFSIHTYKKIPGGKTAVAQYPKTCGSYLSLLLPVILEFIGTNTIFFQI